MSQGNMAVVMVPESDDRLEAPFWQFYLARIHALDGDATHAVPLARRLFETKASFMTAALLQIDPAWDTIRTDPAFQALMQSSTTAPARTP